MSNMTDAISETEPIYPSGKPEVTSVHVVQIHVLTFSGTCYDIRYNFRVKMFGSSLLSFVLQEVHVLLIVFF
jgi:hypothetical protein